jgi:hypothetical protein
VKAIVAEDIYINNCTESTIEYFTNKLTNRHIYVKIDIMKIMSPKDEASPKNKKKKRDIYADDDEDYGRTNY